MGGAVCEALAEGADDAVVHCVTERQAREVWAALSERLESVGLRLHPDKTKVVYCKDSNRRRDFGCTSFTFLGYEFRPRKSRSERNGSIFTSFQPAISPVALKDKSQQIRRWRIHLRTTRNLEELAEWINPVVRGWMNYYGRSTAPSCSSSHGASTITWPGGPCASSSDSKASTPRPWPGCRRSTCMRQTCSPTGNSSHSLPGGLWGPDDGRLSRPVLRAAGGAIPPADSPRAVPISTAVNVAPEGTLCC